MSEVFEHPERAAMRQHAGDQEDVQASPFGVARDVSPVTEDPSAPEGLSTDGRRKRLEALTVAKKLTRFLEEAEKYGKRWVKDPDGRGRRVYVPIDEERDMNFLGLLIGPKGSTQKYLQDESGAKIFMFLSHVTLKIISRGKGSSKDGDDIDGQEPLYVYIVADSDMHLDKACFMVNELLLNRDARDRLKNQQLQQIGDMKAGKPVSSLILSDSLYSSELAYPGISRTGKGILEEVKIPRDRIGHVIGKGGENIRMVQAKSGAFVQVSKENKDEDDFKTVIIEGTEEQVAVAKEEIDRLLEDFIRKKREALDIPDGHELFTLSIPSDTVGLIIGKGGSTIRQIQDRTGALVQMQKDREAEERGAPTRTVLIAGPPNKVAAARREVENIIRTQSESHGDFALGSDAKKVELQVPHYAIGMLIGKSGDTIKALQLRTGARVVIDQDETQEERQVIVHGPADGVDAAIEEINDIVEKESAKHGTLNVLPASGVDMSAYYQYYGQGFDPATYAQYAAAGVLPPAAEQTQFTFDPAAYGIDPAQWAAMDPQQQQEYLNYYSQYYAQYYAQQGMDPSQYYAQQSTETTQASAPTTQSSQQTNQSSQDVDMDME